MKSILVIHAAAETFASALAAFLADALGERGAKVERIDAGSRATDAVQPIHSAVIVCGRVQGGSGHRAIVRFVRQNVDWLAGLPAAFVAVDTPPRPGDHDATQLRHAAAQAFYRATGWTPAITHHVADDVEQPAGAGKHLLHRLVHHDDDTPPVIGEALREDLARFADAFLRATGQAESGHATETTT